MSSLLEDTQGTSSTLRWQSNGSSSNSSPTLRSILQTHLSLSQDLSQALFTSLHAAHSTALPPAPIPRPAHLPTELQHLPIWDLPPNVSPTHTELIPSLLLLHASLDEQMLQARTHLANARRIRHLTEEVRDLQSRRRERVRELSAASKELRGIVSEAREEVQKIKRARQAPLDYRQVLAYAADLARTTSAPPGYSQAKLLKDAVEAALSKKQQPQLQKPSPLSDHVAGSDAGHQAVTGGGDTKETVPSIVVEGGEAATKKEEEEEAHATGTTTGSGAQPATTTTTTTTTIEASRPSAPPSHQPTQAPFVHPEEEGDANLASSAPQLLPFPSDAEMRRGLMGIAMLDESGAGMKSVLPTWHTFKEQWDREQEGVHTAAPPDARQTMQGDTNEGQRREQRRARAKVEDAMEEDLGLDLN